MKPGIKSTELWVTLAVIVSATILAGLGKIAADMWATTVGIVSGGYSLSRGIAKRGG